MMKGKKDVVKARLNELTKDLNLTPEQQAKIKDIFIKSKQETKKVLEEAKAKVKEIKVESHEEIKALLTEEQKQKFQEIRKKHETAPKVEE